MFAYMASCPLLLPRAGLLGPLKGQQGLSTGASAVPGVRGQKPLQCPAGGAAPLIQPNKSLIREVPPDTVLPRQRVACTPSHEITSCFAE